MPENKVVESSEKVLVALHPTEKHEIEIPGATPMKHQTMDLSRHRVTTPDDKHYVVATFNDDRMGRGLVTSVYPQQNGYMTLVRIPLCEFTNQADETRALQRHLEVVSALQQGRIHEYLLQQGKEETKVD